MPCRAIWGTFLQFSTVQGPLRGFPAVLLCPGSSARFPSVLCGSSLPRFPASGSLCRPSRCLSGVPSRCPTPGVPSRCLTPGVPFRCPLRLLPGPVSPPPIFPTYHVRMKIDLSRTFDSRRITSGNYRHAFQALLWDFPIFPTYHVRMKIDLSRTFSS